MPIKMPEITLLVDVLIKQDRIAEAQQTWRQVLEASNWPEDPSNGSLILNGGFEHDIANGGFDWREMDISGARFDFDDAIAHSGSRSLRIQFDGTANLDFENVFQFVAVHSATRYHLSAYVRTDGISTDRGVRFEIFDPRHPSQVQVVTQELTGTNPWTLVQAELVTRPDTQFVQLTLQRVPSWKFDNKLSGTVWIDDVVLTPVPTRAKDSSG